MSVTMRRRFDIFKRDSFTCQYCGNKPPQTILELDHIVAVSKGGNDSDANLNTACIECNRGKHDRVHVKIMAEYIKSRQHPESKTKRNAHLVRIDADLLAKIAAVAAQKGRKIKSQMEQFIRRGMSR